MGWGGGRGRGTSPACSALDTARLSPKRKNFGPTPQDSCAPASLRSSSLSRYWQQGFPPRRMERDEELSGLCRLGEACPHAEDREFQGLSAWRHHPEELLELLGYSHSNPCSARRGTWRGCRPCADLGLAIPRSTCTEPAVEVLAFGHRTCLPGSLRAPIDVRHACLATQKSRALSKARAPALPHFEPKAVWWTAAR